jgi:transposase
LHSRKSAKKPFISEKNRVARLNWANTHSTWPIEKWRSVLWSDETPITLQWKGQSLVWRLKNERYNKDCVRGTIKHDKKINVWGCFSANGVGNFVKINGTLVATKYKQILIRNVNPSAKKLFGENINFIFQQDNDPKHTAHIIQKYFSNKNWEIMEWPAQSPDLNPIENLWSDIKRRTKDRKPKNEDELFNIMKQAWIETETSYLDNLITSMPRRCQAVIEANGLHTKY